MTATVDARDGVTPHPALRDTFSPLRGEKEHVSKTRSALQSARRMNASGG